MTVKAHINVTLPEGTHLDALRAFATRVSGQGVKNSGPAVFRAMIETLPEYEALTGIKSEYGRNPQPRPFKDESGGEDD